MHPTTSRHPPLRSIAVVGGGASGTLLAIHLLRQHETAVHLTLVDAQGAFCRGVAYRTVDEGHLLNVPASHMSAHAHDPEHFVRWLHEEGHRFSPSAFVPRRLYGRYLEALLGNALHQSGELHRVSFVTSEARGVTQVSRGYALHLGARRLQAEHVVLALGLGGPCPLPQMGERFPRVVHGADSPWETPGAFRLAPTQSVLIVGSGLTMVDVVMSLEQQGHRGPIVVVSRHGLLPKPHLPLGSPPGSLPVSRTETLPPPSTRGLRELVRQVRVRISRAEEDGVGWRAVLDGLRPHTATVWASLTSMEKAQFVRHLRAYWDVHRHRMAPEVHDVVQRLLTSGRLRVHAGRLMGFEPQAAQLRVSFRPRGTHAARTLLVDRVVNCTGAPPHRSHPLLRSLLGAGLAVEDPSGLGIQTRQGRVVNALHEEQEGLWAIGPMRRAELWETTAIPEIRLQAEALAQALLNPDAARVSSVAEP